MKRIIAGCLIYFAFLIVTLPASFLDSMFSHYSGGALRITNAQGTLWRGSATLGINGVDAGHYAWKIHLLELMLGRLHMAFDSGADIVFKPAGFEMKHVSVELPASAIALLGKELASIRPGGLLKIRSDEFTFSKHSSGTLTADWEDAASPLSHVNPLGSYRMTVKGDGGALRISLDTLNGPLRLAGSGAWSDKSGLSFNGTGESAEPGISGLLRIAGRDMGGGKYALRVP